jgi:cysteine desulfurase/selenocysteine lyase
MPKIPESGHEPAQAGPRLRQSMAVSDQWAYFDHAAVAPLPTPTAQAIAAYAHQASRNGDVDWPIWSAQVASLRTTIASFIDAESDEVALVNNTTQGISLIAEGYPWQSGDNVVIPDNEFPSNALPWRNLERYGVELRRVPVAPSGIIELADLEAAMDGRTRIVSVSWVGFASGYRIDVPAVAELVHRRGALFMLDAIQGLGAFPISVRDCQVDFLAADGHKWLLGPEGAGVLYVRKQHLDLLRPLGIGWNSLAASGFDPHAVDLKQSAARYEGGSTNMPGMLGLGASFKLLSELHVGPAGSCPVSDSILANVDQLSEQLRSANFKVSLPQDRERQSGIVGITWGESDAPHERLMAARKHCLSAGVVLSVRAGRLRASTHAYNNSDDIGRLVEALRAFR